MAKLFTCEDCGWKGVPAFEFSGGKLYAKCCNDECNHVDRRFEAKDFQEGVARSKEGVDTKVEVAPSPFVTQPVIKSDVIVPRPIAAPAPIVAGNVIDSVRQRAAQLEMEIARLEGMKVELRKLNKMLKAADKVKE